MSLAIRSRYRYLWTVGCTDIGKLDCTEKPMQEVTQPITYSDYFRFGSSFSW